MKLAFLLYGGEPWLLPCYSETAETSCEFDGFNYETSCVFERFNDERGR